MKYKVGDKVKVKNPYSGNGFVHGEIVTIVRIGCEDGYETNCYGAVSKNDETVWYLYEDEVEQITMTNADRIRSMTDEELVNFLMRLMGHAQCFAEGIFPYHPCPQNHNCKQCGIDWLQQPSREDDKHD